jgi:hypothetical protein
MFCRRPRQGVGALDNTLSAFAARLFGGQLLARLHIRYDLIDREINFVMCCRGGSSVELMSATHIQNSSDRWRDPFAGRLQVLRQ